MKEHVAEIVAAYVRKNTVSPSDLPSLIVSVNQSLAGLGQPVATPVELTPAVSIRRSVGTDTIICLDCGWSGQMLKRHLRVAHGLTPDEYRSRWSLRPDYPMTTPNYTARRSALAKSIGLGRPRTRKAIE